MSPATSIDDLLKNIKKECDVDYVTLISRSGTHIGGDVPKKAHVETFVTMAAILLGAAETATSELNENLLNVLVNLEKSNILIRKSGDDALLAIKMPQNKNIEDIEEQINNSIEKIKQLL
ncbi:MAG: roadblock/LC7 domain-containing protein [Thermoplasmatota archaeon]